MEIADLITVNHFADGLRLFSNNVKWFKEFTLNHLDSVFVPADGLYVCCCSSSICFALLNGLHQHTVTIMIFAVMLSHLCWTKPARVCQQLSDGRLKTCLELLWVHSFQMLSVFDCIVIAEPPPVARQRVQRQGWECVSGQCLSGPSPSNLKQFLPLGGWLELQSVPLKSAVFGYCSPSKCTDWYHWSCLWPPPRAVSRRRTMWMRWGRVLSHISVLSRSLHEETVSRTGPSPHWSTGGTFRGQQRLNSRAETHSGIDYSELKVVLWTCKIEECKRKQRLKVPIIRLPNNSLQNLNLPFCIKQPRVEPHFSNLWVRIYI